MLLSFFAVCLCFRFLSLRRSALHLPPAVALYAPDSLLQTIRTTVLGRWRRCLMLVEYNACSRCRILRIMDEPVMPSIPAHNRYIKGICKDDGEILWIQSRKVFRIKHKPSPSPGPLHTPPAAQLQTVREALSFPSRSAYAVFWFPSLEMPFLPRSTPLLQCPG